MRGRKAGAGLAGPRCRGECSVYLTTATAIGRTVGLAQRMQSLAEPGHAYLTGHTAQLSTDFSPCATSVSSSSRACATRRGSSGSRVRVPCGPASMSPVRGASRASSAAVMSSRRWRPRSRRRSKARAPSWGSWVRQEWGRAAVLPARRALPRPGDRGVRGARRLARQADPAAADPGAGSAGQRQFEAIEAPKRAAQLAAAV